MFKKILIANRGEIACRIITTAKRLGIRTVAIYSDIEAEAKHVEMADEAYCVGPAPSQESYLQVDKIIQIAKAANVDAVHPGYGFLSENSHFATACDNEKIQFIGPSVAALNAMASKSAAKAIMEKANIPCTPGYYGQDQSTEKLLAESKKIGFPVLLKAAAGGGGKGMRIVENEKDFAHALSSAKREAKASFDCDEMLVEKYLTTPRHIEIQILADRQGNVIDLAERDCSIQRRHQKIIEEAPAPNLSDACRNALAQAAVNAAKAIAYEGAGTIEFLVEGDDFYFMEMNTRLQVEHGITEMICNLDLVEWQCKIANGESIETLHNSCVGHAIEARIYAEDPYNDFLPASGTIEFLQFPQSDKHVRIDTGIRSGDEISIYYDPMIAKLMVWGANRDIALQGMKQALAQCYLAGFQTNIDFLRSIVELDNFKQAALSTHFIDDNPECLVKPDLDSKAMAFASCYRILKQQQAHPGFDAWQLNLPAQQKLHFMQADALVTVTASIDNDRFQIELADSTTYSVQACLKGNKLYTSHDHQHNSLTVIETDDHITLFGMAATTRVDCFNPSRYYELDSNSAGHLAAPMPGTVVAVMVEKGHDVESGEPLITIEAMKMEHTIYAPSSGRVTETYFSKGDQVAEGDELLGFEAQQG